MRLPVTAAPRLAAIAALLLSAASAGAAERMPRYYAHPATEDSQGVIAPWYHGLNGQCDWRIRVAAETLKRYPWALPPKAPSPAPEFVYNGTWSIAADGAIAIPALNDWDNGDLGQRTSYVLSGLVDYYRYSGDPAAIALLSVQADAFLDHALTPADHPWPRFPVSVPNRGKPYGAPDPKGFMQLDIAAEVGVALVRAYELTGSRRWFEAAKHWADLLAERRTTAPGASPWNRYANPQDVAWEDKQTGGVVFILAFLDEVIRAGYRGHDGSLVKARDAGRAYLRDVLLPAWTVNDTWGRNYWDWPDPVQAENVTEFAARTLMEHPDVFPNWRADVRNILGLFLHHTGVAPESGGDVFSGAWAYPESSGCCGRSLWYGPMELATTWAEYGVRADSEWARELARRQMLLATYDGHDTGVVEDNIDGGPIVANAWFKIAHPMALKHVLGAVAWLPESLGANRENHIVRSGSVVRAVTYAKGRVAYSTFDAPGGSVDVLRLAFTPAAVRAGGRALERRRDLGASGYTVRPLSNGDCIVSIRHDGARSVTVEGEDPQREAGPEALAVSGAWQTGRGVRTSSAAGAAAELAFEGSQVRLIGRVGPDGGLADVYLDGAKRLCGIDAWNPAERRRQVIVSLGGLADGRHTLRVALRGEKNPLSRGTAVWLEGAQWSAAAGDAGSGEGGGPTDTQRMVFGYAGRDDIVDSAGSRWRPATEWIVRSGALTDPVPGAWWAERRRMAIGGTPDPEVYRYGAHAREFWTNVTVGPGAYHVRVKLAETRAVEPLLRAVTIAINGREVATDLDVAATAGGLNRAADLVFDDIAPRNGVIEVRFSNRHGGEAIAQALEVGPGPGGAGSRPVSVPTPKASAGNLIANPGFEEGAVGALGALGTKSGGSGWTYLFAGAGQSYIWPESGYSIHPDWGLPVTHTGKEALRTHTDGDGHTTVYQEAPVEPGTAYVASAWVQAVDLHGKGFGTHPGDSAGLRVQEIDAAGKVVVDHPKAAVTKAGPYTQVSLPFATGPSTVRVRFLLDTVIGARYDEGHVTYDDCALVRAGEGPSAPPAPAPVLETPKPGG